MISSIYYFNKKLFKILKNNIFFLKKLNKDLKSKRLNFDMIFKFLSRK